MNDDKSYMGQVNELDQPHGKGTMYYYGGFSEGDFLNGKSNGWNKFVKSDGHMQVSEA